VSVRVRSTFDDGLGTLLGVRSGEGLGGMALLDRCERSGPAPDALELGRGQSSFVRRIPGGEMSVVTVVCHPIDAAADRLARGASPDEIFAGEGDVLHILTSSARAPGMLRELYSDLSGAL
jgi:hypothetical protein